MLPLQAVDKQRNIPLSPWAFHHLSILFTINLLLCFTSPAAVRPEFRPALASGARLLCKSWFPAAELIASLRLPNFPISEKFLLYPHSSLHHHLHSRRASLQHVAYHPSPGRRILPPIHSPGPPVCPETVHAATKTKGMHATPQLPPINPRIGTSRR